MPIPKMFVQYAVYWAPLGDDEQGQRTFDDPVQIMCRWKDESAIFLDSEGNQQVSNAKVRVDRDVEELGVLWLGKLSDLEDPNDMSPFAVEGSYEIRKFQKIPNRRADDFMRIAML